MKTIRKKKEEVGGEGDPKRPESLTISRPVYSSIHMQMMRTIYCLCSHQLDVFFGFCLSVCL